MVKEAPPRGGHRELLRMRCSPDLVTTQLPWAHGSAHLLPSFHQRRPSAPPTTRTAAMRALSKLRVLCAAKVRFGICQIVLYFLSTGNSKSKSTHLRSLVFAAIIDDDHLVSESGVLLLGGAKIKGHGLAASP